MAGAVFEVAFDDAAVMAGQDRLRAGLADNDVSRDVATLFRVLQRHFVALMEMLKWQATFRAEFDRLRGAVPDTLEPDDFKSNRSAMRLKV